jgi:flagellar hook-length control protein FliK
MNQRTAPLHHVPRLVATLIHVAGERGITRARINLRPENLGGIEVRLQSTTAGVSAHLVADSPVAARLLTEGGDDLRRSLEARAVNLLSLEVATSGEERRAAHPRRTQDADALTGKTRRSGYGDETGDAPAARAATEVLALPCGLLVDVLA